MILNAENPVLFALDPLDGVVEQVYVSERKVGVFKGLVVDGVAVVLGGDFDFAGLEIFDRVVSAAVAEFKLVGLGAVGKGNHLMPEAYAENGVLSSHFLYHVDNGGDVLGVSGPFERKNSVGIHELDFLGRGVEGDNGDVAAEFVETADYVELNAAVDGHNIEFRV